MPGDSTWVSEVAISETPPVKFTDQPGLTTIFTPPPDCSNRWFQSSAGKNVYQCGITEDNKRPVDPRYKSCVAFSSETAYYSPGVCPDGYGVASLIQFESQSTILNWGAFCCRSGMTFRQNDDWCHSTFTTPLSAFVPVTVTKDKDGNETPLYELTAEGETLDNSTRTKLTTLTTGTAWECPWSVEWQEKDLASFPPAYATSLAKRINVHVPTTAAPAPSSRLPQETTLTYPSGTGAPSPEYNTGAKVGFSIGALAGAALVIGILAFFVLKKRRQRIRHEIVTGKQQYEAHELISSTNGAWKHQPLFNNQRCCVPPVNRYQHEHHPTAGHVTPERPAELDAQRDPVEMRGGP